MSGVLLIVSVDRHVEITWNPFGQHAGVADLQCGKRNGRSHGLRLKGIAFAKAFTCALKRAVQTCELAGFGDPAEIDHDLVQWDYGLCDRCREGETPRLGRPRIRLGLNAKAGRFFTFVTASLSIFGFDHDRSEPASRLWNDAAEVENRPAPVVGRAGTWNANWRKSVLKHSRTT
jgi:hypothetical protein